MSLAPTGLDVQKLSAGVIRIRLSGENVKRPRNWFICLLHAE